MYQRIIVPLDGSELAERALPEAEELARLSGAELLIMRVVGFPATQAGGFGMWDVQQGVLAELVEQDTRDSETYLLDIKQRSAETGLKVATEIRRGLVVPAILHDLKPGDVIVMGTHGRGGLKRWFMGSVAEDVVRQSPVPVLLIRTAEARATVAA